MKNIFYRLVFFIATSLATVLIPTSFANAASQIFNFNKLKFTQWSEFGRYTESSYQDSLSQNSFKVFTQTHTQAIGMVSVLDISADIASAYVTAKYRTKAFGTQKDYKIFQVPNHSYLGFIITATDAENSSNFLEIKQGVNIISADKSTNANPITISHNGENISLAPLISKKIINNLYLTLIVMPNERMPVGITNIDEEIASLVFYKLENGIVQSKTATSLKIKTQLEVNLPSCNYSKAAINLNLGKVSKSVIESNQMQEVSANLAMDCKKIAKVNAGVYDMNSDTTDNEAGELIVKCDENTAEGVKVRIRINDQKIKIGSKADILSFLKFDLLTGVRTKHPKFIDLGSGTALKNIKISAKYVQDGKKPVKGGCANAKMGIVFSYE